MNATQAEKHAIPSPNRPNYDLDDDDEDLARWPKLRSLLIVARETLLPVYLATDAAAMRQQKRHSWLVLWAAIFGTLAVLCAIFELSDVIPISRSVLSIVELIAAFIAIVVVVLGIYSALHPDWLLQRFLAEQCRFVKFHILLNPAVWHGRTGDEIRSTVEAMSQALRNPNEHLIHEWVTWRVQIAKRFDPLPKDIPEDVVKELVDYYKTKRLQNQQRYFDRQALRRHRWERWTRNVSPTCFFLSIVAAFSHFLFEWLAGESHEGWFHFLAGVFVLLAAALPVLAMGVRTFRAAHEFGRNKLRFEGMSHFLSEILVLVETQESASSVMPLLREAEIALDSEHRAWLRLMIEAEWFG